MSAERYSGACYCIHLRRSAGALTDFYDKALRPFGLTVAQYSLLTHLARMGSANITQWAGRVGLERSTMVRNVRVLEENKWIGTVDGRGRRFTLTENGKKLLANAAPVWEETQKQVERCLGEEDIRALLRISEKMQRINE